MVHPKNMKNVAIDRIIRNSYIEIDYTGFNNIKSNILRKHLHVSGQKRFKFTHINVMCESLSIV